MVRERKRRRECKEYQIQKTIPTSSEVNPAAGAWRGYKICLCHSVSSTSLFLSSSSNWDIVSKNNFTGFLCVQCALE